jgi:hypothetical protein
MELVARKSQNISDAERVWSLLKIMRDFNFGHFCWALSLLENTESLIAQKKQQTVSLTPAAQKYEYECAMSLLIPAVDKLREVCGAIDFKETEKQAELLLGHFRDAFGDRS